jgi:hypothetical protein
LLSSGLLGVRSELGQVEVEEFKVALSVDVEVRGGVLVLQESVYLFSRDSINAMHHKV